MFITICVIAYNEEQTLTAILKDIAAQDYAHGSMEVVLVRPHEENHAGIRSTEYNTARYGICKRKRA